MEWLSLLPPLLAILVAVWKREVILALLVALISCEWILSGSVLNGFIQTIERLISVLGDAGNSRILMFSLLVGALLALMRESGGITAFVNWVSQRALGKSPRRVGLMTSFIGIFIFIETNLSILTSGILSQSLFDKFKMSRARLAYIIDSTCAPISVLILINAWGAFLLGLLEPYGLDNPVETLIWTIPLNFYALITVGMVFYTVLTGRVHGTMKSYESSKVDTVQEVLPAEGKLRFMLFPLMTMVLGILGFMLYTGDGELLKGSGSSSVLWATVLALFVAYVLIRLDNRMKHKTLVDTSFKGMSKLLPLVTTVLLAMALGASMRALGTGDFVAGILGDSLPGWAIAPVTFIAAAIISFTTGTSWGTFGLLIPIAVPLATQLGIDPSLVIAAVIGGGVFGDHCSPISDTTIVSSLAAGVDHLEHVKTQMPYALFAALLSLMAYSLAGMG